ncbi:PTS sugar transporter subunit IIB [Sporolactobacillus nakayamae]|uniref:PTS system, mannose-specific IIB component n=1 Tax=Sporolactobacillus nakayamae TaxID=269670 RepID=A0A1I2TFP9_9BACL|nr:PTS sugar transporter subunit IIB [Sporolactobacillus nakayamae]SFG63713.1 PTS system, mannose-specific IIB component [Sporolactobacillus nakayamae]
MSIVMARIDNRLLHGIIVTQWAPTSGANRVMVIDDKTANDEIAKASMKMARPAGTAISIITEEKALQNFSIGKYDAEKVFIICKTPDIFVHLVEQGVNIQELIIGGTLVKPDGIQLSQRAYATQEELQDYQKLLSQGVQLITQFVPANKPVKLTSADLRDKEVN